MSTIDEPILRQEMYLSYLNGNTDIQLPEPITRIERYLYALCMNGGGSGSGDGEMNKINSIKVNGEEIPIALDKSVDIKVPTNTSDLENDSDFVTASETKPFEIDIDDDGNLVYTDGFIIAKKEEDENG